MLRSTFLMLYLKEDNVEVFFTLLGTELHTFGPIYLSEWSAPTKSCSCFITALCISSIVRWKWIFLWTSQSCHPSLHLQDFPVAFGYKKLPSRQFSCYAQQRKRPYHSLLAHGKERWLPCTYKMQHLSSHSPFHRQGQLSKIYLRDHRIFYTLMVFLDCQLLLSKVHCHP